MSQKISIFPTVKCQLTWKLPRRLISIWHCLWYEFLPIWYWPSKYPQRKFEALEHWWLKVSSSETLSKKLRDPRRSIYLWNPNPTLVYCCFQCRPIGWPSFPNKSNAPISVPNLRSDRRCFVLLWWSWDPTDWGIGDGNHLSVGLTFQAFSGYYRPKITTEGD